MAAEKLRDLSHPLDVSLLDATVAAFYGTGSKEERTAADHILRDLQNNPDMWLQVVHILLALQVLEGVIKYRWNALPVEQRDGMKNYISEVIVKILKHEWPARWRSFIPDLVAAAKTSETICENCMAILKLLSEEVFDFSRGEMTQQKIKELKQSLNSEFQLIHELCLYVLSASQRAELIRATLATLHAFLSWIPLGYIFESPLLETLLKFFPVPAYRNLTLQCLTEVAALSFGDFYNMQYVKMYTIFMVQLQNILPPTTNFVEAYANGTTEEQAFIQNLALFFTSFYKDMACDTFLKIVQKCKRKFVIVQVGENEPFVSELLTTLPATIADLEPHQIHSFYESIAVRLMHSLLQKWAEIIGQARQSVDFLKDPDVIRAVLNILQTNTSVASSLGTYFLPQISLIFLDMLNVYRMYSELISTSIAQGGPYASRTSIVKLLRSVKRETLKLIETFLDKAEDQPHIGKQFVPPMMDPVLGDYARNLPDARESEVLSLFATIINKYKGAMIEDVPRIFEAVFQCTLEMITKNFEDYPEHRLKFFSLLRAIATHCFPALIRLSSEQLKLVMDSIIWAFRHTERNIAETGLNLLLEMLKNFQASEFCNQFYRTYFLTIEQEIFAVLTDTFHKPGFKLHVLVLQHLFCLVESGALTEPLWDVATVPYAYPNNGMFVREYTIKLLSTSFPNMTAAEVSQFVNGLFESRADLSTFKNHIRDFLVQSKEFSAQDNKDLYAEEAAAQRERERQRMLSIPGLIAPNEIQDEMVDS
ncbi:UNVERIFIED_CONTAM: protein EXPORTIN 1A [Sesamum radiatum]|uniref:Protein EXPORTIN 1A n=1 Tax=Sesamum radiatum TaxID=300843 RepID=A0AAW2JYN2_SESRA